MLNSDFIISKSLANYIHHRRLEVGVSSTDLQKYPICLNQIGNHLKKMVGQFL
ncbi:Uncharacterised protein [Streptococcus pyogenes]|nr:Uncharacterised protein [Streptococcus pyogenes]VHE57154.1 Uncharacterised protein [Streptococcus pyogenes]